MRKWRERTGCTLHSKTGEIQESHQVVPQEGKNWGQGIFKTHRHVKEDRPCVLFHVLHILRTSAQPHEKPLLTGVLPPKLFQICLPLAQPDTPARPAPGFLHPVLVPQHGVCCLSSPLISRAGMDFSLGFSPRTSARQGMHSRISLWLQVLHTHLGSQAHRPWLPLTWPT